MIYVMSDLHGYPILKFLKILESINFSKDDFLYVLGDVVDRGRDGVKIIKWLMQNSNTMLLLGNHEDMLLNCEFVFEEGFDPFYSNLYGEKRKAYELWISNGGGSTFEALNATRSSEQKYIFEYLKSASLYKELTVNGRKFVLTHSGFGNFSPEKPLYEYSKKELLWHRPTQYTEYFDDVITVFGHTPTFLIEGSTRGRARRTATWIDIDVGASIGLTPMVLRLDDLKEFYFDF